MEVNGSPRKDREGKCVCVGACVCVCERHEQTVCGLAACIMSCKPPAATNYLQASYKTKKILLSASSMLNDVSVLRTYCRSK